MPDQYIIRTSDRGTFKRCREQWNFTSKIRENWEPKKDIEALSFGTAVHAGLEAWYDPQLWSADRLVVASNAITAFKRSLPTPPQGASDEDLEHFKSLIELGIGMLKHYFDWSQPLDRFTPVYTEIEFEVPILWPYDPNKLPEDFRLNAEGQLHKLDKEDFVFKPVVYQGRIDLIVEDESGKYYLADHKTAKKFSGVEWLELDDQTGSYGWAVAHKLGVKIDGIIYNELRKDVPHVPNELKSGQLSKDKSQNTTYELYLEELTRRGLSSSLYTDILEHFKEQGNKFFRRTVVRRSQREFELLGGRIALEAIDMVGDPLIYPTPSQFNCNGCQFYGPCIAKQEGSDFDYILNENFQKRD